MQFSDALYDWLTKGTNAGVQADVGLGPVKLSQNVGFEITRDQDQLGDFWYEPISDSEAYDVEVQPVEVVETEDGSSNFFGIQAR